MGKNKIKSKELINFVKNQTSNGENLSNSFKKFAKQNGLSVGSVRNYYYKTIKDCKQDNKLCNLLGVDSKMFPKIAKAFTESEERDLVKAILLGVSQGKSVRGAILDISYNNEVLALRNQNKYRNAIKNNQSLVNEVVNEIKLERGDCYNPFEKIKRDNEISKVEGEINQIIDSLLISIKRENKQLINRINLLEKENKKLKELFKKYLKDNNYTKEFFKKYSKINA